MDIDVNSKNENIRKIEDIIDIQKANGSFNSRQVSFNLASDTDSTVSAKSKSLESGLTKTKSIRNKKKLHKLLSYRQKSPLPDVLSWPSDSDITVLRMKLFVANEEPKETVDTVIPGDGIHQHDSSSMVNLATLIRQSQPPSKHSFTIEECLVPLSSWERDCEGDNEMEKEYKAEVEQQTDLVSKLTDIYDNYNYQAVCSHTRKEFSAKDSNSNYSTVGTGSKFARFLRLYFCPCCTCLYKIENMKDEGVYSNNRNVPVLQKV